MNYSPAVRLSRQPLYLKVAWGLLLALGAFPVLAPIADVVAVVRTGLPTDHMAAFVAVTGTTWAGTRSTSPGVGAYVSLLEIGYAIHELVFGLLFLVIVAIPFRRGERWAWWACWIVLIADVGYSLTFGRFDPTILRQSLIADIALPVLLLVQFRRFFGDRPAIA